MHGKLIFPLDKSPIPLKGRRGLSQDWRLTCKAAAEIYHQTPAAKVLVISGFKADGLVAADIYENVLLSYGVRTRGILKVEEGVDTISQLKLAFQLAKLASKLARNFEYELLVISTIFHYPRVWWLCRRLNHRGIKIYHRVVVGIPRLSEMVNDIILTFLFPIIDILRLQKWFEEKTVKRRAAGKI